MVDSSDQKGVAARYLIDSRDEFLRSPRSFLDADSGKGTSQSPAKELQQLVHDIVCGSNGQRDHGESRIDATGANEVASTHHE